MNIYLHCGDGVTKEEGQVAIHALLETIDFLVDFIPKTSNNGFHAKVLGNWSPSSAAFQNLERHVASSFIPEIKKFDGSNILLNLIHGRKDISHFDIAISSKRITARDCNGNWLDSIFGLAGGGTAIVSTHEFNHELKNEELRHLCLRRVIIHKFFHILGLLPNWRETNIDNRLGLNCGNVCVMRQGMSVSEWKKYAKEEENKGVALCSQCEDNLLEIFSRK